VIRIFDLSASWKDSKEVRYLDVLWSKHSSQLFFCPTITVHTRINVKELPGDPLNSVFASMDTVVSEQGMQTRELVLGRALGLQFSGSVGSAVGHINSKEAPIFALALI
jgi:hypothetical protein